MAKRMLGLNILLLKSKGKCGQMTEKVLYLLMPASFMPFFAPSLCAKDFLLISPIPRTFFLFIPSRKAGSL
jgi:hypothetical protein